MGKHELWGKISGFISNRKAMAVWGVVVIALIVALGIFAAIASSSETGNMEVVSQDKEAVVQVEESKEEEVAQAETDTTDLKEESEETVVAKAADEEEVLDYAAVFIVSINPKVKIYVDAEGIVLKMEKMNADAAVLLDELEWANKKLEDCFNTLLLKAHEKGFLKNNAKVSISVAEVKKDINVSDMTQEMEKVIEETCKDININIKLTLKVDETEETMEKEIIGNESALTETEETVVEETTEEVPENNTQDNNSSNSGNDDSNNKDDGSNSGSDANTPSNPPTVQDEYSLVWEDNFDGEELNRDDWNVELHDPGWVNSELQEYVDSEENIYLEDGKLVLKPVKTINADGTVSYTSGRVNTQNKNNFKYGKFEVSAKVPSGKGYLPAFWLMAADENLYGQWPRCGEIDIMEVLGDNTDKVYGTIHYGHDNVNGHKESQGTLTLSSGSFAEEFHTFTCEWEPGKITWYVDGIKYHEESEWYTAMSDGTGEVTYPAPFDQEFYIILNLAVGGNWPGEPAADTDFDNQAYEIDYVRVYQKDSYDENVTRPEKEDIVLREPDVNGNYLINGDFEVVEDLTEAVDWQFKTANDGVGNTTIATEKDGVLAISGKSAIVETTNCGTVAHSIQLMQNDVPLKAGARYELSFDAYATAEREMSVNSKAPDRGWYAYLDKKVTLTTEKKTYSYQFDMIHADDNNCTVEFNMGNLVSTETIVIDNVSLKIVSEDEELRESIINPDKAVRADGNYIYNGEFKEGDGRLGYWDISSGANVSVTSLEDGRRLKVVVADNASVTVSQKNVPVVAGEEYVLSMDTEVPPTGNISVNFDGADYIVASGTNGYWEKDFITLNNTNRRDITFTFSGKGTFYLDNVRVDEKALIKNGSFNAGFSGYSPYEYSTELASHNVDSITYDNAAAFDINSTGDAAWKIQLKQNGVDLEKDQWYKLSLDAKSTINRQLMFAIQRDGSSHKNDKGEEDWTPYSGEKIVDLTSEWQTFELSFQMTNETDLDSVLSISMGAVGGTVINEKHSVYIDNILLEKTDAPKMDDVVAGENMLKNPEFSKEGEYWEKYINSPASGDIIFGDGMITYALTNVGTEDHHAQLKQMGLQLEAGETYRISFKAKSSEARTIKSSIMSATYNWYNGMDTALLKDVEQDVSFDMVMSTTDTNAGLFISLGMIKDVDTPASTITLSDISVVKVDKSEDVKPDDGGEMEEIIEGNMVEHGDFTLSDAFTENDLWQLWPGYAGKDTGAEVEVVLSGGNAKFNIKELGSNPWDIQLEYKKLLKLEEGCTYKVKYDAISTETRTIKAQLGNGSAGIYIGEESTLEKDVLKTVEFELPYNNATNSEMQFVFQLGKFNETTPLSTVTIDNISIVKVEKQEEETPSTPEVVESNMFERGDLTDTDGSIWDTWVGYGVKDECTFTFSNGTANYSMSNLGSAPWDTALNYNKKLTLEKGTAYNLSFDISTTEARKIKVQFMDGDIWYGGQEIELVKGDNKINITIDVSNDTSSNINFSVQLGQFGDTPLSDMVIDNMVLVKVPSKTENASVMTLNISADEDVIFEESDESVEETTTETETIKETASLEEQTTEEIIEEESNEEESDDDSTQEPSGEDVIVETKSEEEEELEE